MGRKREPRKPSGEDDGEPNWAKLDAEFAAQSAELEQSGRRLTRGLFWLFLGLAAFLLAVALLTGINTGRRLNAERSALAQVIEMTERKNSEGGSFYYPVLAFDLPDGRRQRVQLSEGSWPPAHQVGDLVTVLYLPERPLEARIASSGGALALWTWTLVTGIIGIAFALAAWLARILGRQGQPAVSPAHERI